MTATMAVAVCLPLTYSLNLTEGLALLLGLYVGGISDGLIPEILLNIPGTPSSITTTFDGYPMTMQGEGEKALKTGIASSLFGGLFSSAILFFFAPALADIAIKFSYIEKFLIIFFALTVIASLSKNVLVGIFSGVLGIWLSLIGTYDISVGGNGKTRLMFDFMVPYLEEGFSLLPVLIGLFGLATILEEAEKGIREKSMAAGVNLAIRTKFSFNVFKGQLINLFRSATIATFVGMLPGVGGSAASVLSYTQQKNFSKNPSKLGAGAPEGVIASESANNGLTGGALIPLLSRPLDDVRFCMAGVGFGLTMPPEVQLMVSERTLCGASSAVRSTVKPPIDWPTRCAPGVPVASRTAAMSATAAALPCTPDVNVELPKPRQSHVITRKPLAASVGTCWNHAACVPPAPCVSMIAGRSSSPLTS